MSSTMTTSANELLIGAHTSIAGGVHHALVQGKHIGATTIQLFTANQKRWVGKPIDQEEVDRWRQALSDTGIKKVMSHDSYLINLGSPDPEGLLKSREAFKEEFLRCELLNINYLNFHPGAALKESTEACLDCIVESLLGMEKLIKEHSPRLLLESTAGQGSAVGHRFEHLAYIIEKVHKHIPIGVCIDTCHAFAAGYDIRTPQGWDATLEEFEKVVGLKHLYTFHVNDSQKGLGTRVDRHAQLGEGLIGIESFKYLMRNPKTRHLPKYLETPDPERWVEEIKLLRQFAE